MTPRLWLGCLLALPAAPRAAPQFPPAAGREWYEETTTHGFRFRPPKDWKFFPAEFGDANALGRYLPEGVSTYRAEEPGPFGPALWLLAFEAEHAEPAPPARYYPDLPAWLAGNLARLRTQVPLGACQEVERTELAARGFARATEVLFRAGERAEDPRYALFVWSTSFELAPEKSVALVATAPSGRADWAKWRSGLRAIARTCARAELATVDTSGVAGGGPRAEKHRRLLTEVGANPGWELGVTPNYFVISNSEDRDFVAQVQRRLEAIRAEFERDFPLAKALRAVEVASLARLSAAREGEGEGEAGETAAEPSANAAPQGDPLERSRCSVVRVCSSQADYHKYGGPPGTAGYWWPVSEELVLYDDQDLGGRRNTWATLQHEAFHQFIFYFLGDLAPGTWFNEGHADFYGGYELSRRGAFEVGRRDARNSIAKEELRSGEHLPLEVLVRATRAQYYGQVPLAGSLRSRYPQGWSLVYFLRTGSTSRLRGWRDEWGGILGRYLDVLIETRDIARATDAAFEGVDWNALAAAWSDCLLHGR